MNELVDLLRSKGPPSVSRLKRLYRQLSKRTHPDLTRESHEAFLTLKRSYEEALALLGDAAHRRRPAARAATRPEVLRSLYLYALKFNGAEAEGVFAALLEQTRGYRPAVHSALRQYQAAFRQTYPRWQNEGKVFYAHALWLACIRELAWYLSYGAERYLTLLQAYCGDLSERTEKLEPQQKEVLRSLSGWLLQEAKGGKLQIIEESASR